MGSTCSKSPTTTTTKQVTKNNNKDNDNNNSNNKISTMAPIASTLALGAGYVI